MILLIRKIINKIFCFYLIEKITFAFDSFNDFMFFDLDCWANAFSCGEYRFTGFDDDDARACAYGCGPALSHARAPPRGIVCRERRLDADFLGPCAGRHHPYGTHVDRSATGVDPATCDLGLADLPRHVV